jgi:hypothetical protein
MIQAQAARPTAARRSCHSVRGEGAFCRNEGRMSLSDPFKKRQRGAVSAFLGRDGLVARNAVITDTRGRNSSSDILRGSNSYRRKEDRCIANRSALNERDAQGNFSQFNGLDFDFHGSGPGGPVVQFHSPRPARVSGCHKYAKPKTGPYTAMAL